ncbi:hypothetical protein [Streptomyces sp. NBC_00057]
MTPGKNEKEAGAATSRSMVVSALISATSSEATRTGSRVSQVPSRH